MSLADNARWVEALEIFHNLYVPDGPYKTRVPRLVREIVTRLEPANPDEFRKALLRELGRRGGNKPRLSSSSSSLPLFPGA